jgi:hypothetical protein
LARRERMRTNSGPYLNSASSSAITLPRNSGAAASTSQSGGKLNRRQSSAAARAEYSADDSHGVHGVLWPQALSNAHTRNRPAHFTMGRPGLRSFSKHDWRSLPLVQGGASSFHFPDFIFIASALTFS